MKVKAQRYDPEMAQPLASARRTNRRGQATRESMLDAAVRTWGAVKYQFGDIDGLWAAVLRRTAERRGELPSRLLRANSPLRERVATIIDTLFDGLTSADSRAIETLRRALPRDGAELERLYPQTAAELQSWGRSWIDACQRAFADVDVESARIREVATFIPGAMRGIVSERQLGSYYDLDLARRGLTNAIVTYLEGTEPVKGVQR
jgi:AcrR family transcriptional regulator